jgi:hypothetical protein
MHPTVYQVVVQLYRADLFFTMQLYRADLNATVFLQCNCIMLISMQLHAINAAQALIL